MIVHVRRPTVISICVVMQKCWPPRNLSEMYKKTSLRCGNYVLWRKTCWIGWSLFCNFWNLHFSPSNCVPLCKKTYLAKYKFNWTIFRDSSMTLKFRIILISSRQIGIYCVSLPWKIYCYCYKVFTTLLLSTALTSQIVVKWSFNDR